MIGATFNRIKNEDANDSDTYVYEFSNPLVFTLTMVDDEPVITSNQFNIVFNKVITPPQRFYKAVLDELIKKEKNNELDDSVKLFNRNDFNIYFSKLVSDKINENKSF